MGYTQQHTSAWSALCVGPHTHRSMRTTGQAGASCRPRCVCMANTWHTSWPCVAPPCALLKKDVECELLFMPTPCQWGSLGVNGIVNKAPFLHQRVNTPCCQHAVKLSSCQELFGGCQGDVKNTFEKSEQKYSPKKTEKRRREKNIYT